jgi:CxxC-x17-CxxC domain-containing protein
MYKSFGGKKSGGSGYGGKGGSRFGGAGGGGYDRERKQMFDAVCASCSQPAQVPFRPNGRKPVLCSNCFKKEGGGEFRSESRGEFRKPAFGERSEGNGNITAQLKEINDKLDAIIEALEE